MYHISVEQEFDAAHYLRGYQGRCEALHGHRYKVAVTLAAPKLNDIGMAFDLTRLKQHLGDILVRFDHTCLNDVPPFDGINPSAENIATTIYGELEARLAGDAVTIASVTVWESPQSWATYSPA